MDARDMRAQEYSPLMTKDNAATDEVSKARLARISDRELRRASSLTFWGKDGMLLWFLRSVYKSFFFYTAYCGSVLYAQRYHDVRLAEDVFHIIPGYCPFIMQALQFLAAFLVGVGLTDAVSRYQSAMGALTKLSESIENLRMVLLSSTEDQKFRIAVQVHITWLIVLLRKKMAFYTEDFNQPLSTLIDESFSECILFKPEVLWAFDLAQAEFVLKRFLVNAKLVDNEGMVTKVVHQSSDSCETITNLLMVRSPTTTGMLRRTCVEIFLLSIPLFNDDIVTLCLLPLVACAMLALVFLAKEIAEPWGQDYHHLPVANVMHFLSVPSWFGHDSSYSAEAIAWLNKGMIENNWTWNGHDPIPREKRAGSNKGDFINFEDYRTLHRLTGYNTFSEFVSVKAKDMAEADARGRRMPKYLHWRSEEVV